MGHEHIDLTNAWLPYEASHQQTVVIPSLKEKIEFREVECVAKITEQLLNETWADAAVMVPSLVSYPLGKNHISSIELHFKRSEAAAVKGGNSKSYRS